MLNRILASADAGSRRTSATVAIVLGVTQTIGYGSLYYAFGVLAAEMAADTGYSLTTVFGLFSLSLLTGGAAAPYAGRLLDRHHPGLAMAGGSGLAILGGLVAAGFALKHRRERNQALVERTRFAEAPCTSSISARSRRTPMSRPARACASCEMAP